MTKISDHQHDLGVKGQSKIYLESMFLLLTRAPLSFFDKMFQITVMS